MDSEDRFTNEKLTGEEQILALLGPAPPVPFDISISHWTDRPLAKNPNQLPPIDPCIYIPFSEEVSLDGESPSAHVIFDGSPSTFSSSRWFITSQRIILEKSRLFSKGIFFFFNFASKKKVYIY